MRRVHLTYPSLLPKKVLQCIAPDSLELSGLGGSVAKPVKWTLGENTPPSVIFNIHVSSDGVTPYKTAASSLRCIMGRIDSIESPHLGLKVYVPDPPPFFIGIYKGEDKNSDLVLEGVVNELLFLSPDNPENERQVYCRATAWIADAVEKSAVCGIVATSGTVSCPRCEQPGLKTLSAWQLASNLNLDSRNNHVYFPRLDGQPRTNEKWASYFTEKTGREVLFQLL